MKVVFRTNLDNYNNSNYFPNGQFDQVPRIGDSVEVLGDFKKHFESKKLPTSLKVVDVTWTEKAAVCELWYKQIDIDVAKARGTDLF